MDSDSNNYYIEVIEHKDVIAKGIYYVEATLQALKVTQITSTGKKITAVADTSISKIVFSYREEKRNVRKLLENNPKILTELNKKHPNKNILRISFKVIAYLGKTQEPAKEWQQKESISKESIKTILITSPPIMSSVSISLHRSMSLEDL